MTVPNITNYNVGTLNEPGPDEWTPLLKDQVAAVGKGDVVSEASSITEVDEEAAQCLSPTADKACRPETPRNIAGVISILLLGMSVLPFLSSNS